MTILWFEPTTPVGFFLAGGDLIPFAPILRYGFVGVSALLAFLSYRLLDNEQKRAAGARPVVLKAIRSFQVFAIVLSLIALSVELVHTTFPQGGGKVPTLVVQRWGIEQKRGGVIEVTLTLRTSQLDRYRRPDGQLLFVVSKKDPKASVPNREDAIGFVDKARDFPAPGMDAPSYTLELTSQAVGSHMGDQLWIEVFVAPTGLQAEGFRTRGALEDAGAERIEYHYADVTPTLTEPEGLIVWFESLDTTTRDKTLREMDRLNREGR